MKAYLVLGATLLAFILAGCGSSSSTSVSTSGTVAGAKSVLVTWIKDVNTGNPDACLLSTGQGQQAIISLSTLVSSHVSTCAEGVAAIAKATNQAFPSTKDMNAYLGAMTQGVASAQGKVTDNSIILPVTVTFTIEGSSSSSSTDYRLIYQNRKWLVDQANPTDSSISAG